MSATRDSQAQGAEQAGGQAGDKTSYETDEQVVVILRSAGKIESETPGRMRVRVRRDLRTPERMARIEAELRKHPSVSDVQVNVRTGSVVVTYKKTASGRNVFVEALGEAALLAEAALDLPSTEGDGGGDPYQKLDQQLADLVYKVERVVYRKTGLRFRGQIIAGTVAGLGIAQMAITGITIEMLPGPIMLWIAWDIYHRVAQEPPLTAEDAPQPETAGGEAIGPEEPTPNAVHGQPAAV